MLSCEVDVEVVEIRVPATEVCKHIDNEKCDVCEKDSSVLIISVEQGDDRHSWFCSDCIPGQRQ